MIELDAVIAEFVREKGIPIFGVASPEGFEHALSGLRPLELMPTVRSVVVIGRPFVEHPLVIDEQTHLADQAWWTANEHVYRGVAEWRGQLINLFDAYGKGSATFGGYWVQTEPAFSHRLAQYEAGVGVFGRCGICINPKFGGYYYVASVLTEAQLKPTDRSRLQGFRPCEGCSRCADVCPVRAIDASADPATCYDRELCVRFNLRIRQRYENKGEYQFESVKVCTRCYQVCPWATTRLPVD